MTIETMQYVPADAVSGKQVLSLHDLQGDLGTGPYTYQCSVCRKNIAEKCTIQLANVVLQCPHCGAYNEV